MQVDKITNQTTWVVTLNLCRLVVYCSEPTLCFIWETGVALEMPVEWNLEHPLFGWI